MQNPRDSVFLKHLMDFNVVPIIIWSYDGDIITANDAYLDLVGYSREEMAAGLVNWKSLTPPEYLPLDEHCMQQLANAPVATPYVKEYVRKDGCRIAVKLFNARDLAGSGQGVAMIIRIYKDTNNFNSSLFFLRGKSR